jgi:hypothetical protein
MMMMVMVMVMVMMMMIMMMMVVMMMMMTVTTWQAMVFNYIWTGKHPFEGQYENALMLTVEIRGGARPLLSERMPVRDHRPIVSLLGPCPDR